MIQTYYRIDLKDIPQKYQKEQLVKVMPGADIRLRKEVARLAYYFRREFHYDFVQFEEADRTPYTAYLFPSDTWPRVWAGACCFRTRRYEDLERPFEALQWAWIHPYCRNRKVLSKSWATLRANQGDFFAEPPLSHAMRAFLLKHNRDSVFTPIYENKDLSKEETLTIFVTKCGRKKP